MNGNRHIVPDHLSVLSSRDEGGYQILVNRMGERELKQQYWEIDDSADSLSAGGPLKPL